MAWLILSIALYLIGTVYVCRKISLNHKTASASPEEKSFRDAIEQRKDVLFALKEATAGYSIPSEVETLKSQMEDILSRERPTENKLKATELEFNALKKITANSQNLSSKSRLEVKDFNEIFKDYFSSLSPASCSELKEHARILESINLEITRLDQVLNELNQSN